MVALKNSEVRIINDALMMNSGNVLNFSNRTFKEFFEDEFRIDIYHEKYSFNGSSKAKHMRAFVAKEEGYIVARVLRRLWEHRETLPDVTADENNEGIKRLFLDLLARIDSSARIIGSEAIEVFTEDLTLEELVADIERDIAANKPGSALDRLHTYCMKRFSYLLEKHGVTWSQKEPLNSRVGKYVKALEQSNKLRDLSHQIIKNSIGTFEKFNHVRNNDSLAHDNQLPREAEARFIFVSVEAILRFVRDLEDELN